MRLAVIETSQHGGLLHYAAQLADGLAERGHEVDLLVPRGNELLGRTGAARMRDVLTPPAPSSEIPPGRLRYAGRRVGVALRLTRAWARVMWEVRPHRYDAVLLTCSLDLWLSAGAGLVLSGVPGRPAIGFVCHNVRAFNRWAHDGLFASAPVVEKLLSWLFPRFDVVFVHGERSRSEFEDTWPPSRLAIIPHGDERLFAGEPPPPAAEERILFFGDWRKVKGLSVLMAAFDRMVAEGSHARLTIAGTPSHADLDPEVVHRWAASHPDRVEVIDRYVPFEDVPAVFGSARVVVTPYLVGYQSGVLHLAMTMARAVVSTDVGDLGSAVDHERTGLLVPPGDEVALARALSTLVTDSERADSYGVAGRRRMLENASWDKVAQSVERELARSVDGR